MGQALLPAASTLMSALFGPSRISGCEVGHRRTHVPGLWPPAPGPGEQHEPLVLTLDNTHEYGSLTPVILENPSRLPTAYTADKRPDESGRGRHECPRHVASARNEAPDPQAPTPHPGEQRAPLVLAIDTTHEYGSLALVRGADILEKTVLHAPTGFAHVLFPNLAQLLERHGIRLTDIDCFAAASGPGSFTGVRVGLACIKGLAEALEKPAMGISNLQALAASGHGPLRAPVIDARRGDIYGGLYDSRLHPAASEIVAAFPAWLETLPEGDLEFLSTDFTPFRAALAGTRFQHCPLVTAGPAFAGAIGRLAASRYQAGERPDPASLDANYVRRSDAEVFWKE